MSLSGSAPCDYEQLIMEDSVNSRPLSILRHLPNRLRDFINRNKRSRLMLYFYMFILFFVVLFVLHNRISSKEDECKGRIVGYINLRDTVDLTEKQLSMLTHIIFGPIQISINETNYFRFEHEKKNFFNIMKKARKFNVKTIVSLSGLTTFRHMSLADDDTLKRKQFGDAIETFLRKYEIDGVDMYSRFISAENHHSNLLLLAKDLRKRFNQNIILSQYVLTDRTSYVVEKELVQVMDFLNIESRYRYDHTDDEFRYVGHAAPLYSGNRRKDDENVDNIMRRYSCLTGTPRKLNMVIYLEGRYWRDIDAPNNDSDAAWRKIKLKGGDFGVSVSRKKMEEEWDIEHASWNDDSKTSYVWNPDYRAYLSFESERSVMEKVKYAKEKNLGGMSLADFRMDDGEHNFLTILAANKLCPDEYDNEVKYNCSSI